MASREGKYKAASKPAPAPSRADALPLFFKKPRPLDAKKDKKSLVVPTSDYSFARATNSLPLNAIEFIEAAKHYPIVFTLSDTPSAVAILGLEKENYFVQKGKWRADTYVPAYVRQYPFIFFENDADKKFYLCIDEEAAVFSTDGSNGGAALYDKAGKPTALANNALQFCNAFYRHHQITLSFCSDLKKHKLLVPYESKIKTPSGKTLGLGGFQMIDEKAFNKLPNDAFLEFRKKGWLPFIYFAMASTANWNKLMELAE